MRKLSLSIAVTLVLLASLWHFKRTWVVLAQGPTTYTVDTYATYQFNTLKHPTGLAFSDLFGKQLFIADTDNHLIRVFHLGLGSLSTLAGNGTAGYVNGYLSAAEFNNPIGIDVLSASRVVAGHTYTWNIIYVSDSSNYVLRYFCTGTPYQDSRCPYAVNYVETWAGSGTKGYVNGSRTTAEFAHMAGIHAALGYTVDSENHAIRTVGSSVGTFAGTGNPGFVNGYRTSAQFNSPTRLTTDSSGNTYVADAGNFVIRKIDTGGNVTTFAGSGSPGFVDGQGSGAQFNYPGDIIFNPVDGYFYITDSGNNAIRRMDSNGNVTTYAGAQQGGLVDGSLLQARFQAPTGLVIANGYLYVADTMNNAIRRIDMSAGQVSTYVD